MSEGKAVARAAHGPLSGIRLVEFDGLGPVPFAGMLLADMGADVVRIVRPSVRARAPLIMDRGRCEVVLDLKSAEGLASALDLLDNADAAIEGFRPGVVERLGLGPETVLARNSTLVYGRMTGYGQNGPLSAAAGHDINYIALTGALQAIGPVDRPLPPLNLVGDYGGGALYLAMGVLAGILAARASGRGQVIDCAMCDGAASLMTLFCDFQALGRWQAPRGSNLLDGGSPVYGTYRCADGLFLALGAIEPHFWNEFCNLIGLSADISGWRDDPDHWGALREAIADIIITRDRDEWAHRLEASDGCVTPVLSLKEAPNHPHLRARGTFVFRDGLQQPAPAPRFSETPGSIGDYRRCTAVDILREWKTSPRSHETCAA